MISLKASWGVIFEMILQLLFFTWDLLNTKQRLNTNNPCHAETPSYKCHAINTESSLIPCKNKLQTYDQNKPLLLWTLTTINPHPVNLGVSTRSGTNCIVPESYVTLWQAPAFEGFLVIPSRQKGERFVLTWGCSLAMRHISSGSNSMGS